MKLKSWNALVASWLLLVAVAVGGCPTSEQFAGSEDFPRVPNNLFPEAPSPFSETAEPWHLGSGKITGVGPEQPIAFPHYRHVTELKMECEYCHQAARKSIHAGVPSTSTCMNCHTYVIKDNPEIQKVAEYYAKGEPIPWKKVHDLPDFVHFSHKRHVQGGVNCTECHGQVGLQGRKSTWFETNEAGEQIEVEGIKNVMVRETTMQMGWCLDCHASHPSVDKNYGERANIRRAELKDCWTCHK